MMSKTVFGINIAGVTFRIQTDFKDLPDFYTDYLAEYTEDAPLIQTEKELVEEWINIYHHYTSFAEYSIQHVSVSCELMNHNRFLFHSAAFIYYGRAWLLCGESGVGKSTQYKNLKSLYPEEIEIINGDKPALEIKERAEIYVHPSPWNGKENFHGNSGAPLGGIVILKQTPFNRISALKHRDAVLPVFLSIIQIYKNERMIKTTGEYAEHIVRNIPVYLLENKGDFASSELLMETIKRNNSNGI